MAFSKGLVKWAGLKVKVHLSSEPDPRTAESWDIFCCFNLGTGAVVSVMGKGLGRCQPNHEPRVGNWACLSTSDTKVQRII